MEEDGQTYLLPYSAIARLIITAAGAFAFFMAPYELWRGVWPLNITTPFFGFIMLGGMSVGATFLHAGLFAPSGRLVFRDGVLEVEKRYLTHVTRSLIPATDIQAVEVVDDPNSDGPSDWQAAIRTTSSGPIYSRPLATPADAEALAVIFREKLGLPPGQA